MTIRHSAVSLALAALVLGAAACSRDKKAPDTLAQDSSLAHDLQLANNDTASKPQFKDVPSTPPPAPPAPERAAPTPKPRPTPRPAPERRPPPAPTPAPAPVVTASGNTVERSPAPNSEGRVGVVAAGTTLALAAGQRVCTNTNTVGDRFTASLADAVTASNGVVIPAGATAVVEVTSLKRSEQAGDNMAIGLTVRSISYNGKTYPVAGEIASAEVEKVRAGGTNDAGKVIGGAVVGAILGRVLGGKNKTKGTIIGAAGGAAAGAVLAHQTEKYDACIASGGRITVRLDQPLHVQAPSGSALPSSGGDNSI